MNEASNLRIGKLELLAAMTLSGTLGWFVLQSGQPVWNVVFARCLIGSLSLAVFAHWRGLWTPWPFDRRSLLLCLAGGLALVGNWLLLFNAYHYSSIALATVVYHAQPFILVMMGALLLGETLSWRKAAALLLAFAGLLLIVLPTLQAGQPSGDWLLGAGMALGAALLYAVATLITKRLPAHIPPHLIACLQTLTGVALLWPMLQPAALGAPGLPWAYLAVLGVVHTGGMYILMYSAFRRLPTHLIGMLGFVYPAVAILVDYLAYGHVLRAEQWLGVGLIVAGNLWMNGLLPALWPRRAAVAED